MSVFVSICIESHLRLSIVVIVPSQPYRPPGSKSFRQAPRPIGPSGLLGPQGPHELPTKVHNAIQTIGQGTKSTFTQVELYLKAKRHCLEDFQTPPPV